MAMEVETRVPNPIRPPCSYRPLAKAFEIKVICVRINSSSTPLKEYCMEITFPPRSSGDATRRLHVNGSAIAADKAVSLPLNMNRVDLLMAESIFVSTNAISFLGSLLRFEIRVKGLASSPIVVGVLRRERGLCVMECEEGGGGGVSGGLVVDVYFAGRTSMERPVLLNGVVHLKMMSKEDLKEKADVRDLQENNNGGEEEEVKLEKESGVRGEASLFREGVRVGMGIGLGMSVGVGFGVGLVIRTYKTATQTFRRFI